MKKRKIFSIFCLFFIVTVKHVFPQAGQLDTTFGQAGVVTNSINLIKQNTHVNTMALQNDGKVVVAGFSGNNFDYNFALARFTKDGILDNTFGINGKEIIPIGTKESRIISIALQNDGKIVATGYSFNGDPFQFTTVRYNQNGTLDKSFGTDGITVTPVNEFSSLANSMVIQNDGKILVGGYILTTKFENGDKDFATVRYNSDGSLDNTFGVNGIVTSSSTSEELLRNLAIQIDGKIIAATSIVLSDKHFIKIRRFNSNGSLDNTFGVNGIVTDFNNPSSFCRNITIQSDGKIVIAGHSSFNIGKNNCMMIRYNADGTTDNTFGKNGIVIDSIGNKGSTICSLNIKNDGSIEATGFSINDSQCDLAIIHHKSNGRLDSTFGANGIETIQTGYDVYILPPVYNFAAMQIDGNIVTAGTIQNGITSNMVLYRFNNSTLDETFGINGTSTAAFGSTISYCNSAVIQINQNKEKIITAGHSWNGNNFDFALSRFSPNGILDSSFGINGNITSTIGSSDAFINSAAIQSDGKIVVTGSF